MVYKKITIVSVIFMVSACVNNKYNTIQPISSYNDINFENIYDDNTLVLFDVDETLVQPEDVYLINEHTEAGKNFRQNFLKQYPKFKDWKQIEGIVLKEARRPLIEPDIVKKINLLKKNKVKVMALTGMNTGEYWPYDKLEQWRYEHLKGLGFQGSFDEISFEVKGFKRKPVLFKGIIATDLEEKGDVLGAVLDKLNYSPNKIIMFDDTLGDLKSVASECKKRGISFKGYNYKGAIFKEWDQNLIQFQADYLIQNKKWLNDKVAKEKLKVIEGYRYETKTQI